MSAKSVKVAPNYLEYLKELTIHTTGRYSPRVSFKGTHNRRKTLVLWAISLCEPITSKEIWAQVGDCEYGSIRSAISRYLANEYISASDTGYRLRAKGLRFLYGAVRLAPLKRWVAEAQLVVKARDRYSKQQ